MRKRPASAAAVLALAALSACAGPKPATVADVPAGPPQGIAGRYQGTARLLRAAGPGCPRSGARSLEVYGDSITLSYRLTPRQLVQLTAPIAGDGTIHAEDGSGSIDGKIGDGRLDLTVASRMCENHWMLRRVN